MPSVTTSSQKSWQFNSGLSLWADRQAPAHTGCGEISRVWKQVSEGVVTDPYNLHAQSSSGRCIRNWQQSLALGGQLEQSLLLGFRVE